MALICPVGEPLHINRRLPDHQVVVRDESAVESMAREDRELFEPLAVVQTDALPRAPEGDETFDAPCLVVTARQDSVVGFRDQWSLVPHYPRATFAVLDAAGHNAQIERPDLVNQLILDWRARVSAHCHPEC